MLLIIAAHAIVVIGTLLVYWFLRTRMSARRKDVATLPAREAPSCVTCHGQAHYLPENGDLTACICRNCYEAQLAREQAVKVLLVLEQDTELRERLRCLIRGS